MASSSYNMYNTPTILSHRWKGQLHLEEFSFAFLEFLFLFMYIIGHTSIMHLSIGKLWLSGEVEMQMWLLQIRYCQKMNQVHLISEPGNAINKRKNDIWASIHLT